MREKTLKEGRTSVYCIASPAVNVCVSQDLLRLIKQLSRAVALRGVFAKKRFASSLYTLPVFDMEACQEPPYIHPVLPSSLSLASCPAIGDARGARRGGRICQKSRHGVPRANCRYNLRGETEIPGC